MNLTISKVIPGPGQFRPSGNIVVNQYCHITSGLWDDAAVLLHRLYGDFSVESPGIFHMQPGGVLEFLGSEKQTLTTLSPDSYNSFRTLKINCYELSQGSNMSGPNKIYENLSIEKGTYSVGKLTTETLGAVTIAAKSMLRLDRTTFLINNLHVANGGLFFSIGISGDSARIGKAGTINYNFGVDGIIQSRFTRFDGMNVNGIYITKPGIINGGFNHCTFSTSQANATMLKINNNITSTISDVKFSLNAGLLQKSVSKTVNWGDVILDRYIPLNSPDFEVDVYGKIFWTTH
jgi:hypothetical protein